MAIALIINASGGNFGSRGNKMKYKIKFGRKKYNDSIRCALIGIVYLIFAPALFLFSIMFCTVVVIIGFTGFIYLKKEK